jgi:hypothetical protein
MVEQQPAAQQSASEERGEAAYSAAELVAGASGFRVRVGAGDAAHDVVARPADMAGALHLRGVAATDQEARFTRDEAQSALDEAMNRPVAD